MPEPTCPDCNAAMNLRSGRYGWFFGCSRFPDCKGLVKATPDGQVIGAPATIETRKLRSEVLSAVRAGTLGPYDLPKRLSEMTAEDCVEALAQAAEVNDISEVELTLWERLELDGLLEPDSDA